MLAPLKSVLSIVIVWLTFGSFVVAEAKVARDPCSGGSQRVNGSYFVTMWEQRAPDRLDEDVLITDGIGYNRNLHVYLCRVPEAPDPVEVLVRAWVKPQDGQWREIRLMDLSQLAEAEMTRLQNDPNRSYIPPAKLSIVDRERYSRIVIPVRREGLNVGDSVRVEVGKRCESIDNTCEAQVFNHFLKVGRFGLLPGFSDSLLFVKRPDVKYIVTTAVPGALGQLTDSVNFRPSPGVNFGLTFIHRKHAFLQFLEPGFGFNISLLNWRDGPLGAGSIPDRASASATQVGIGMMGSMFDNCVTVVYGWNTNVSSQRTFFGVGFSVVGLVRKAAKSVHP